MKIIFLDIDGVLNCEEAYNNGFCKYNKEINDFHYQTFYPKSKDLLNKLIENTGAKIVISSTWKHSGIEWLKKVWELEKMAGEIIDITPSFRSLTIKEDTSYTIPRGCEIDFWLISKKFSHINWDKNWQKEKILESSIDNYIIIDDDEDMLYEQRHHFIHVLPSPKNKEGFNEFYYKQALNILSKDVIKLNF
jgi:hypothetical protein